MRGIKVVREGDHTKVTLEQDIPTPEPSSSEVLVRVVASCLQPSDVLNASGGFGHTTFPRIPGRDYAGVIVKAPPESPFPVGTAVYGTSGKFLSFTEDGAHAEYIAVPISGVAVKPKTLSFAQAAVVGTPFTTAMLVLQRTAAAKGETVLVLGASGAVGSAVSQIATNLGCKVLGAARRGNYAVNMKDDPKLETVKSLTGGKGADVVVDTVGSAELMHAALGALGSYGRLGLISAQGADTILNVDVRALYRAQHSVIGCNSVASLVETVAASLQQMTPWFEQGSLTAPDESAYGKVSIEELKETYEKSMSGELKGKKFVLVFPETS